MTEKDRFYSEFEHVYDTAAIGQLACREIVLRLNIKYVHSTTAKHQNTDN